MRFEVAVVVWTLQTLENNKLKIHSRTKFYNEEIFLRVESKVTRTETLGVRKNGSKKLSGRGPFLL